MSRIVCAKARIRSAYILWSRWHRKRQFRKRVIAHLFFILVTSDLQGIHRKLHFSTKTQFNMPGIEFNGSINNNICQLQRTLIFKWLKESHGSKEKNERRGTLRNLSTHAYLCPISFSCSLLHDHPFH